jgi:hypothetical protein
MIRKGGSDFEKIAPETKVSGTKVSYGISRFVCLTVMTKSTLTLTESGLLAVLLEHQRHEVRRRAQRRAHREHLRAAFWNRFARLFPAFAERKLSDDSAEPSVQTMPRQV